MRFYKLNVRAALVDYLGRLYGSATVQKLFMGFLQPLADLFVTYNTWRRRQFYLINVTGQVKSLENHLNLEYDPINKLIEVVPIGANVFGLPLSTRAENSAFVQLGNRGIDSGVAIAAKGDSHLFYVRVPVAYVADQERIKATIRQFKLAGKQFQLIFF